ncbi:NPP1 family protein [Streptomyces sp. 7-21]|uniref:NPP1 family protein n=1 Tax=Streptomyces sp. 7-21 TaxID=2802283 RepID=UPI0035A94C40
MPPRPEEVRGRPAGAGNREGRGAATGMDRPGGGRRRRGAGARAGAARHRARGAAQALPGNASARELAFQPACGYDTDGCCPTARHRPGRHRNGGLAPGGALNGECRDARDDARDDAWDDAWDPDTTNGYSRQACNNGRCAVMYALCAALHRARRAPARLGARRGVGAAGRAGAGRLRRHLGTRRLRRPPAG